jgi:hypothetical protein
MKSVSGTQIGFGAVALMGVLLLAIGTPATRKPAPPRAFPPLASPSQVEGGGVILRSAAIALPDDVSAFPELPGAGTVTASCTACHSASMVLVQPPLKREQWQAIVDKMRDAYKAPVTPEAEAVVVDYLTHLSGAEPGR